MWKDLLLSFGSSRYDSYLKYLSNVLSLDYNYLKTLTRDEVYDKIASLHLQYTLYL